MLSVAGRIMALKYVHAQMSRSCEDAFYIAKSNSADAIKDFDVGR